MRDAGLSNSFAPRRLRPINGHGHDQFDAFFLMSRTGLGNAPAKRSGRERGREMAVIAREIGGNLRAAVRDRADAVGERADAEHHHRSRGSWLF